MSVNMFLTCTQSCKVGMRHSSMDIKHWLKSQKSSLSYHENNQEKGKSDDWESTISKYSVCLHNILITDSTNSGDPDPSTAVVLEQGRVHVQTRLKQYYITLPNSVFTCYTMRLPRQQIQVVNLGLTPQEKKGCQQYAMVSTGLHPHLLQA